MGPIAVSRSGLLLNACRATILVFLSIVAIICGAGVHAMSLRVYLATQAQTFNLVDWEARQLTAHVSSIAAGLASPATSTPEQLDQIRGYLKMPLPTRGDARWDAERAIESELSALIGDLEIGRIQGIPFPGLFPPVAFRFTSPPSVLIVAPRDRLVVQQSVFLQPGISPTQAGEVEDRVGELGVSPLVTPIGGLATYPSMVVESSRATDVLSSVAHEWIHAYLFFRPLGAAYWSSQQGRSINETVADLAGVELGAMLADRAALPPPPTRAPSSGPDRVFRQEMRATRLEVERLLSLGAIDEAEQYMERRRLDLEQLGYRIRRLNQAYFAFHGSYAEGVAGDNRIGSLVRDLRTAAPSLAAFLASASSVQSTDDLRKLLNGS